MLVLLITSLLVSCQGDKEVESLVITSGLKTEYSIGEVPDFSNVRATVTFNDGTSASISSGELIFGALDTSTPGQKILTITYSGFTITSSITVRGADYDLSNAIILDVKLPDSLALFEKSKDNFINKNGAYVVGDDSNFYFKLYILAMIDGKLVVLPEYTGASKVYLAGSPTPLEGEELNSFVTIDEENNAFDFTEAAIGKTFTISTRPRDGVSGIEDSVTRNFTVTIVDGYNIYNAYELNYITNATGMMNFSEFYPNDTRTQSQIVDDFLWNEKHVVRPTGISSFVLHDNLTIETTDIPAEYFLNKNRDSVFYDFISVFGHELTPTSQSVTIHGNYFTIYSHKLPCVAEEGVGNQDNQVSEGQLFHFRPNFDRDKNYNHKLYSANINNLMLVDNNPTSDNEENSKRAMLGLVAIKSSNILLNLENNRVHAYFISLIAEYDYHTVNINECEFLNSWQNHLFLNCRNNLQEDGEEPLDKSIYPRLTLNITKSIISKSGGPAIISVTNDPENIKNKHSGPNVYISEDSTVESWVTGKEAWFTAMDFGISVDMVLAILNGLENSLNKDAMSSIQTDKTISVDGVNQTKKYMNIIMVNLLVPDMSNGLSGVLGEIQGKTDIDGKITIGDTTVLNMDDHVRDGKTYNFENEALHQAKSEAKGSNLVLSTPSGGAAHTKAGDSLQIVGGDIKAGEANEYLNVFYFTMGLVFGGYHPI